MDKIKKKFAQLLLGALALSLLTTTAYADEAPPSLDFGSLLGDPQAQQEDAPPSVDINDVLGDQENNNNNNNNNNASSNEIDISANSISPRIFNPTVAETTLKFTINKDARVDVEIKDRVNQTVATLVSNQLLTDGEYEAKWNGTTNNQRGGTIVPNGDYTYKITAKNPSTGLAKDTATGTVTVRYTVPNQSGTNNFRSPESQNQAASTVALQNMSSGRTSETGPAVLLYSIFPLAGWITARRRRK